MLQVFFAGCRSLISLSDISKWNTKKVKKLSKIFNGCYDLNPLPDISKWNTNSVTDMNSLFSFYQIYLNGIHLMLKI